MEQEIIFYYPGDVVTLRQNIPNQPEMYIVKKKTMTFKPKEGEKSNFFQGMLCRWFTTEGLLQEAVFSTKDLIKL